MIKKLTKILLTIFLIFTLLIFYLSIVGIKTEKFNKIITNKILTINKNINLDLKDVKFLLNPYNFKAKIVTKDSAILLEGKRIDIEKIITNVSLKSLIFNEFSIDDLEIYTKPTELSDVIFLVRSFKNSTELFLLDKVIKSGFLKIDIKLKFDDNGSIEDNYQIRGFIKNSNINFFNHYNAKKLNFEFDIGKKKYSITKIKTNLNGINLFSSLIDIVEKEKLFFVKGKIESTEKDFNKEELNNFFNDFLNNLDTEQVNFSSVNNFSFNINKKLKINNLSIKSEIKLNQFVVKNNFIDLKSYLPKADNILNFKKHKILIDYKKDKLEVNGEGKILIKNNSDFIKYKIFKNKDKYTFDIKTNIKNNKLLINLLDYEKKENLEANIKVKGNFKKNDKIKFNYFSLLENDNEISFKNLILNKDFKIVSLDSFNLRYLNKQKIKNQIYLKKSNSEYTIEGESLDSTKLINELVDSEDDNSLLFSNFKSKINIKINKLYIDEVNFVKKLSGNLNFNNNTIDNLLLKSTFPNNKMISLSIETNSQKEKITKLITNYPGPLIKRYKFIEGFEGGYLNLYSVKKNGVSNSVLVIDNFKIKKIPIFASLLSLASLQGIADLLTGEGIRFSDFEMKFSNKRGLTTIEEIYATGPAVSLLMEGYIESKKLISLKGTLVPATTINKSIASLPLLGKILVGKKTGEGVFGVSFKVKGPPKDLKTTVNPIKTLTPRFITRTLEKIKKNND